MVHVRSGGYRYKELIDWFIQHDLHTREEAKRLMLVLNAREGYTGLTTGQSRALDEYYGVEVTERRKEKEEFVQAAIGERREIPVAPKKRFELFEDKRGRVIKRNIKTGRFARLSKSEKRKLTKGKR